MVDSWRVRWLLRVGASAFYGLPMPCAMAILIAGASACGDEMGVPRDDAGGSDAGIDAGAADAGLDAGATDAGIDGGTSSMDASTPPSDAGDGLDAGTLDGGTGLPDGGSDAGPGTVFAGCAPPCSSGVTVDGVCQQATCSDGVRNGQETREDCGGPDCPRCVASCSDGLLNGGESDVDCGGLGSCDRCADGQSCERASDCTSGLCTLGTCGAEGEVLLAALNGAYSGDLGGLAGADQLCSAAALDQRERGTWRALLATSADGDAGRDLTRLLSGSAATSPVRNILREALTEGWSSLLSETGRYFRHDVRTFDGAVVNAGAGHPVPFRPSGPAWVGAGLGGVTASDETCLDWTSDAGSESGRSTELGRKALFHNDSFSCSRQQAVMCVRTTQLCETESCRCLNGVRDERETDVDCGGPICGGCVTGAFCGVSTDCGDRVCTDGRCAAATCDDGVRNGDETDIDCGGSHCSGCAAGERCETGEDCGESVCDAGVCLPPTCDDGVTNGLEADVDCGGASSCERCRDGMLCPNGATDCEDGTCTEWAPGRNARCGSVRGHLVHMELDLNLTEQAVAKGIIGESAFLSGEAGELSVVVWNEFAARSTEETAEQPQVREIVAAIEAAARARGRSVTIAYDGSGRLDSEELDVFVMPYSPYFLAHIDTATRFLLPEKIEQFLHRGGVVLWLPYQSDGVVEPNIALLDDTHFLFDGWAPRLAWPDARPGFLANLERPARTTLRGQEEVCLPIDQRSHPLAGPATWAFEGTDGSANGFAPRWRSTASFQRAEFNSVYEHEGSSVVTHILF